MRASSTLVADVEAYESLCREHNVSFDAATYHRVNDLDLVEHLTLGLALPGDANSSVLLSPGPDKPNRPFSPPAPRSMASFDVLARFPRLSLPVLPDRPASPVASDSSADSITPAPTTTSATAFSIPVEPTGTAYRLTRASPDAIEPVSQIAGAPDLTPLPASDAFSTAWTGHLQRGFLRAVGNARLPAVVVCGHMCVATDGATDGPYYVYVLALREPLDHRDPAWINLCLDLEDLAMVHAGVLVEVVQTVGWIEDL